MPVITWTKIQIRNKIRVLYKIWSGWWFQKLFRVRLLLCRSDSTLVIQCQFADVYFSMFRAMLGKSSPEDKRIYFRTSAKWHSIIFLHFDPYTINLFWIKSIVPKSYSFLIQYKIKEWIPNGVLKLLEEFDRRITKKSILEHWSVCPKIFVNRISQELY